MAESVMTVSLHQQAHQNSHDSGKVEFACKECDYKCKRIDAMKQHQLRHMEQKPFKCNICGKEYTQKQALEVHLRHHTGQMEGRCELCGREFLTKYSLMLHMKRRHVVKEPDTSDSQKATSYDQVTMYRCEECQALFVNQEKLAIHILTTHMKDNWNAINSNQTVAVEVEVGGSEDPPSTSKAFTPPATQTITSPAKKYVSLLPNKKSQSLLQRKADSVQPAGRIVIPDVAVQHVLFDLPQNHSNIATLINPDTNEETLVTISDPQLSNDLFVSMPTANFDNILATSSIENADLGQYQDYVSVKDAQIVASQPIIGEIVTTVLDLGQMPQQEEYVETENATVTETVEVPVTIDDAVTVDLGPSMSHISLNTHGLVEESVSDVITYDCMEPAAINIDTSEATAGYTMQNIM